MSYYAKEDEYNILVMELLGKNIEELMKKNGRRLSLKTVILIADQMVRINLCT